MVPDDPVVHQATTVAGRRRETLSVVLPQFTIGDVTKLVLQEQVSARQGHTFDVQGLPTIAASSLLETLNTRILPSRTEEGALDADDDGGGGSVSRWFDGHR